MELILLSIIIAIILLINLLCPVKRTSKEEIKFDPNKHWEKVPGGMKRIKIPGGWIYEDYIAGRSLAMTFVPDSKKGIVTYEVLQ